MLSPLLLLATRYHLRSSWKLNLIRGTGGFHKKEIRSQKKILYFRSNYVSICVQTETNIYYRRQKYNISIFSKRQVSVGRKVRKEPLHNHPYECQMEENISKVANLQTHEFKLSLQTHNQWGFYKNIFFPVSPSCSKRKIPIPPLQIAVTGLVPITAGHCLLLGTTPLLIWVFPREDQTLFHASRKFLGTSGFTQSQRVITK